MLINNNKKGRNEKKRKERRRKYKNIKRIKEAEYNKMKRIVRKI